MLFLRWLLNFTSGREGVLLSREEKKKSPIIFKKFKKIYEGIRAQIQCN